MTGRALSLTSGEQERIRTKILAKTLVSPRGCWLLTGNLDRGGYASLWVVGKTRKAHRLSYAAFKGDIPLNMTIDHICLVRNCVNPDHLRLATMRENSLYGNTIAARNHAKQYCDRGHPLSGDNLRVNPDGRRNCKRCDTMHQARYRARRRAKNAAEKGMPVDLTQSELIALWEMSRLRNGGPFGFRPKTCHKLDVKGFARAFYTHLGIRYYITDAGREALGDWKP